MIRDAGWKLLVLLGTALLCAVLLAVHHGLREPKGPQPAPAPEEPRVEPAAIESLVLDQAAVEKLLPHLPAATWVRYDPLAVVRPIPDKTETVKWPEHHRGEIRLHTNNLGFREDRATAPRTTDLRVLVLGDSHTFGLVENGETFPNVLERKLRARPGAPACEVLNAGVSGSGPFEERALLGVLLDLQPQLVICVLYTGNDFINAQAFADFETRRARVPMPPPAQQRFKAARELERERMAQNTSQLHSFLHREGDAEVALAATIACYREMAQYCAERGARFLVAILPAKEDVEPRNLAPQFLQAREMLLLCEEDYALSRQLAARFADALAAGGIEVIDLLPALAGRVRPMYWRSDHHLGVDGHTLVAAALEERVAAILAELAAR